SHAPARWSVVQLQYGSGAILAHEKMASTRRDVRSSVRQHVTLLRLIDPHGARRVESLREALRETGRHVLNYERGGWQRTRELGEHRVECARPAGRCRDRHDVR